MTATLFGWAIVMATGTALLLSRLRWFRRVGLADRIAPYLPHPTFRTRSVLSVSSFRDVLVPLAEAVGTTVARLGGRGEDLARRLERIHSPVDASGFRLRQLAVAAAVTAFTTGFVALARVDPLVALVLVLAAALVSFAVVEHRLAAASARRQQQLFLELPVVAEQLGMLVSSGWSLGSAVGRIADRGRGAVASDLARVVARVRHGLGHEAALREWAELADVASLHRLVAVLTMHQEASDLGSLISAEAAAMRREAHRRQLEQVERRTQQVWIPVTVAALLPGTMLMAVPFIDALRLFSG